MWTRDYRGTSLAVRAGFVRNLPIERKTAQDAPDGQGRGERGDARPGMWDTRSIAGFGTGFMQRSFAALHGYWRAIAATAAPRRRSRRGHDLLHHVLVGRRMRFRKLAIGAGVAACLAVIAVSALWLRLASGPV
jgi:hypothetical protein